MVSLEMLDAVGNGRGPFGVRRKDRRFVFLGASMAGQSLPEDADDRSSYRALRKIGVGMIEPCRSGRLESNAPPNA